MSNYGRNFYFAQPPVGNERAGRYSLTTAANQPIGVPVVKAAAGSAKDGLGLLRVELAAEGAAIPLSGLGGIGVYEHAFGAFNGYDPETTSYSDLDFIPKGRPLQVISGPTVKVGFRNTVDDSFYGQRDYDGRVMVAGAGATPTLVIGDMLTPGVGTDTDGYWKKTTDPTKAWLVITELDDNRVEARLNF